MPDTKAFITTLMAECVKVNPATYYEDGPRDGSLPYVVVSVRFLDTDESTVTAVIEMEHWHRDEPSNAVALETLCNTLRGGLDGIVLHSAGKFRAAVWFESQAMIPEPETELIHRQQTYQARIYFE